MNTDKAFGEYLGDILHKYGIKGTDIAKNLGVSRQHVSSIINGNVLPGRDCFDSILAFLDQYTSPAEERILAQKMIFAKTGFDTNPQSDSIPAVSADTIGEQVLLKAFRNLTKESQMKVINYARQEEINMLDIMAENAGVAEEPGVYIATPRKANSGKKSQDKDGDKVD